MRSFSKRLTRRIVIALMLTMALITVGVFYQASWIVAQMTGAYFSHVANIENESVEKRLRYVQVAAQNSIDEVECQLSNPDSVFVALTNKLQLNPDVVLGFGAGFVPDYYPQKGRWFEPYAMWRDGKVVTSQNGSAEDDYLYEEWYAEGLATDSCYWSDPYYMGVDDDSMMICTYAVPIRDAQGRKVGVFGADLSLKMLHDYLLSKDLKANTEGLIRITRKHEGNPEQWVRSIIVGKQGYYISHPDTTRILRDNFFSEVTQQGDTAARYQT